MTKREAKRFTYAVLADYLTQNSQGPFTAPSGSELPGREQIVISEVFLELAEAFKTKSVPRTHRSQKA